jgi:putative cell wall-binding protein
MTTRRLFIAFALLACVTFALGAASTAFAFQGVGYLGACDGCHTGVAPVPVATLASNDGASATYNVTGGSTEWALFNGTMRVAGAVGATGSFTVPVPGTYTLYGVAGTAGLGTAQGLGKATVAVTPPLVTYTITATAGAHGAISPAGAVSAAQGSSAAFTFAPDSGYHVDDVVVDGASVGGVARYTFDDVQADHAISVTFAEGEGSSYAITASAGDHGSISPGGARPVAAGGSLVYTMQPDPGYQVASITVDGEEVSKAGWYTFINVVKPHTISVTFAPNPPGWFTITPYPGEHGRIWMAQQSVAGTATVPGVSALVSIVPEAGYRVSSLVVDGQSVTPKTWYIFYNVRAGHTIEAEFAPVAVESGSIGRCGGSDRYATAIKASQTNFDEAAAVVLATGVTYPDALSASGLAGCYGAPLLLTAPGALSPGVAAEIARLGAAKVIIVGGEAAVSASVAAQVDAIPGVAVQRIGGGNRYETAAKVAREIARLDMLPDAVFIARGDDFADALAVSPLSYANGIAVLLTRTGSLAAETAKVIEDLGIQQVTIVGGEPAVSGGVAAALSKLSSAPAVGRVYGSTRYETAEAVARYAIDGGLADAAFIGVATGVVFPDALGGGVVSGANGGVLVLTAPGSLSANWNDFLTGKVSGTTIVEVYGGSVAVADKVMDQISAILF